MKDIKLITPTGESVSITSDQKEKLAVLLNNKTLDFQHVHPKSVRAAQVRNALKEAGINSSSRRDS